MTPRTFVVLSTAWVALVSAPALAAQQFQEVPGLLPAPVRWTEAVIPLDANEDGKMDVFFAYSNGWSIPGDLQAPNAQPLPPALLVNTGNAGGDPVFVDQSASWLPAALKIHGKGAGAADFTGDAHDDIVLAVAFLSRQRLLVKNMTQGKFVDESFRLPASLILNSFSAGIGDLDNDGDLDLVFTDAGASTFGPPGGLARLLINDGTGFFTNQPSWMNASPKQGAQNAKVIDIDNDFDLDVIVDGKSPFTQIYRNDGTAHFALDPIVVASLPLTYEIEWADLDNDADIDAMVMSYPTPQFLEEGTVQNLLADTGTFALVGTTATIGGHNGDDDNDFAMIDVDDDGDLDIVNATLGYSQEKLYLNAGVFGHGFLAFQPNGFTSLTDSTLDLAVADYDGDGDYDGITGQGETGSFASRYYRNVGPADTQPPFIGRVEDLGLTVPAAFFQSGSKTPRAWVQDSVWDDGVTFVKSQLKLDVEKNGVTTAMSTSMTHAGGQIWRGVIAGASLPPAPVGVKVTYRVSASDPNGNTATSVPRSFIVCGFESFGQPSAVNKLTLAPVGEPIAGQVLTLQLGGGAPNQPATLIVGFARASIPAVNGELLVDLTEVLTFPLTLDVNGNAIFTATPPVGVGFEGKHVVFQAAALDPGLPLGVALSTGVGTWICAL